MAGDLTIVILAGGRATRLPGKLERDIRGEPLLARVYRNLRESAPVVIAGAGSFRAELDAFLDCPVIVDRWVARGPLAGLLSACAQVETPWIAAIAGDAPRVTGELVRALRERRMPNDEAIVPEHDGRWEPLAALYDRAAVEREAYEVMHSSDASMHALLRRLRTRTVPMPAQFFLNVNTPADLDAV